MSEWSLRLWPAIFGLVGCLAVYVAGRMLFERRTDLISSAVLATSGLLFVMGHLLNLDMTVSVLLSCALLAFLLGTRETQGTKRRLAMWAFFVFSALATLTKGLIGIVIPGLVIGTWVLLLSEWSILKTMYLPSRLALFLVIVAPWYLLVSQTNPGYLKFYFLHEHFQRYLTKPEGYFQWPWTFIPVLLLGLFPWTVFLAQAVLHNLRFSWRQRHRHKELLFLLLWAGWVFLLFSGSSYKQIPYILPMIPPLAILIGQYIAAAWDNLDTSGIQSGAWILLFAISLALIAGLAGPRHYLERYSNWPSLEVPNNEATIVSTQQKEYGDLSGLTAYIYVQTGILVVAAVAALLLLKRQAFRWGFIVLTLNSVSRSMSVPEAGWLTMPRSGTVGTARQPSMR